MAGVHSLWHAGDQELEPDLQRVTSEIDEGWRPSSGVWIRTDDDNAEVAVWGTDSSNDRVSDDDLSWIERKFRMCVEHLEHYLGPADLGGDRKPGNGLHVFADGAPACARWEHGTTQLFVYLEHEDSDLPILLFVRAEGPNQ